MGHANALLCFTHPVLCLCIVWRLVAIFLPKDKPFLRHPGRIRQITPISRMYVVLQQVAGRRKPPRNRRPTLEETHRIVEGDHAVEVVVGGGEAAAGPLHGHNGLFVGPLDLDVYSGPENVDTVAGEVEAKVVAVRAEGKNFGAAERGQVYRLVGV